MKVGNVLLSLTIGVIALACTVWLGRYRNETPAEKLVPTS